MSPPTATPARPTFTLRRRLQLAAAAAVVLWRRQRSTEPGYDGFLAGEVARYATLRRREGGLPEVDDATWCTLHVERWMRLVGQRLSIVGRQALHARLRSPLPAFEADPVRALELSRHPACAAVCAEARAACRPLREVAQEFSGALFGDDLPAFPAASRALGLLPAAALAGVWAAVALQAPALAVVPVAAAGLGAAAVLRLSAPLRQWRRTRRAVLALLAAGRALGDVARRHGLPLAVADASLQADMARAQARLRLSLVERIPALADYANLFLLHEAATAWRGTQRFRRHLGTLQAAFEAVAQAELLCALAAHLAQHEGVLTPVERTGPGRWFMTDAVDPLVTAPDPVCIDVAPDWRGLFIAGPHGVGNPTLLRTAGLNVLLAKAFGFCHARAAGLPSFELHNAAAGPDMPGVPPQVQA